MNEVEKARIQDVPQMHRLINYFASKDLMLARSLSEIYENIRDYFVVRNADNVVACAALHIDWSDLAEVRSVAVAEDCQKQGIGERLVMACLEEAKVIGITTIFCFTYQPDFFKQLGFADIDKMELPRKVWTDCYRCPKFPNCDEVALVCNQELEA